MSRHLLWLVIGAAALACSGPGSGDDDDDDGGSSGESGSGGSSGSKGGTSSTSNGGSTSGSSGSGGGATTGWYCSNVDAACVCIESPSLSGDDCTTPKPTCCFGATADDGTNACLCYPPDAQECVLRGMTGYPSRNTCP